MRCQRAADHIQQHVLPTTAIEIKNFVSETEFENNQKTLPFFMLTHSDRGVHLDARRSAAEAAADAAASEVRAALERLRALGDACGRWCGAARRTGVDWAWEHAAHYEEVVSLGKRLVAIVPGEACPAASQRDLVRATARLAQVARAADPDVVMNVATTGAAAAAGVTAEHWRAYHGAELQLLALHGTKGEGAARRAAAAECERLGAEMDAAWRALPLPGRRSLMALPWENDPPPAAVGTWTRGTSRQNGEAILRPALRQVVPPELGYEAASFRACFAVDAGEDKGDSGDLGQAFVERSLLPAARRVLPLLEAAARRVAAQLREGQEEDEEEGVEGREEGSGAAAAAQGGRCEVRVPPLKTKARMDEKAGFGEARHGADPDHLLHEYPRQASNVDVARVMLVVATPAQAVRALALFKETCEVARVKNRFSPEAPLYGYRDILLNLRIDGVYCEVQIGLAPLVAVRRKMHKFYGIVRSTGTKPLISLAKPLPVPSTLPQEEQWRTGETVIGPAPAPTT